MLDYRDNLRVDSEKTLYTYPTKYINTKQFNEDVQNILNGNKDKVSCDFTLLLEDLKRMPVESYTMKMLSKVKILLKGYELLPKLDDIFKSSYEVRQFITKNRNVNISSYNVSQGEYWFNEDFKIAIISVLEECVSNLNEDNIKNNKSSYERE